MQRAQHIDFEVGARLLLKHKKDFIPVKITGLPDPNLPPPDNKQVKYVFPGADGFPDSAENKSHMDNFYLPNDDEEMVAGRKRRRRSTRRRKTAHKKRKTLSKRK